MGLTRLTSEAAQKTESQMAPVYDPHNLQRFVDAQRPVYQEVCAELRNGLKTKHWMWFIFPQIRGLGHSPMAAKFGISSRHEAGAYLEHPILGGRLEECTRLLMLIDDRPIEQILGTIDALKFKSSMTLFAIVAPNHPIFKDAVGKYFGGRFDPLTLERL
jgi:uncharacterized protein (DUF1810 family)